MIVLLWAVVIAWSMTLVRLLLNLLLLPRLECPRDPAGPPLSVIIPARNEERNIDRTVRAMLAQDYPSLEVIVVDDRSDDATAAILADRARADGRLRVVAGVETPEGWLGKPWALQQGSAVASGEILLFVDADVVYEPGAVAAAVAALRHSGAAMLMVLPRLLMGSFWERVLMPHLAMAALAYLPTWLSNRTTIVLFALGGGSGNLVWRDEFVAAGGHTALRDAVIDDIALARLLRRRGKRTIAARAEHLVAVRMYEGGRAVVEGFTKNLFSVFERSYALGLLFVALSVLLHLLPYVWAFQGLLLGAAAVGLITLVRVVLFASLGYPLHYAVWAHPLMTAGWIWIALRSMWITGVRRQIRWRGRSYDAGRTRFGA